MSSSRNAGVNEDPAPLVLFLPMFHIYGLSAVVAAGMAYGRRIVYMAKFNPEEYMRIIQTYRVSLRCRLSRLCADAIIRFYGMSSLFH